MYSANQQGEKNEQGTGRRKLMLDISSFSLTLDSGYRILDPGRTKSRNQYLILKISNLTENEN